MAKNKYKEIIKFGGTIDNKTNTVLSIIGALILVLVWHFLTITGDIIPPKILTSPLSVFRGFKTLYFEYDLLANVWYSVSLNLFGYLFALSAALPLGFLIGIYPLPKALFQKYTDGLRYLPPPAITGIFILIFGLGFGMKASFLAFSIFMPLLPSVIQKVNELQNPRNDKDYVYLQTIKTLGANSFQKFTKVYFPYVMGKVWDDIVNLVAVTWTYIVIIELLNKEGGVGGMIHTLRRQGLVAEYYGVLFTIVLIGITLDFILKEAGKLCFPYKYDKISIIRKLLISLGKTLGNIKKFISKSKIKSLFFVDK